MIGSSKVRIVQSIINSIENDEFNMHHKLQREPGQWSKDGQSLLIDSLLRGIPINIIYTIQEQVEEAGSSKARYAIIDGIQRTTTINDFTKNKFKLGKDLEPVDGEVIAGKTFTELSEKLQKRILNAEVSFYDITTYTEAEVRSMYHRQNNGRALNKKQLRPVIENDDVLEVIFKLSTHELFTGSKVAESEEVNKAAEEATGENKEAGEKRGKGRPKKQKAWQGLVSNAQIKNAVDRDLIIETLMLIFDGSEKASYNLAFTDKDINTFIADYLNDNVKAEAGKIKTLEEAMNKLYLAVKDNNKIKINTSTLPMVLYGAYRTLSSKKSFTKYVDNLTKFIAEYDTNEEYKPFCEKHTTSKENVQGRLNYFKTKVIPS